MVTDAFGLTFTLVEDISEWRLHYPVVDIEQEESLYPSFIQLRLDSPSTTHRNSTIHRDEEAVRPCLIRRGPPNDPSREDGEIGQEHTWPLHSSQALGDWEVQMNFRCRRTVGVRGSREDGFP